MVTVSGFFRDNYARYNRLGLPPGRNVYLIKRGVGLSSCSIDNFGSDKFMGKGSWGQLRK